MSDPFDGYQFLSHLRSRWRLAAIVFTVAVGLTLIASMLMAKKYTAHVTLVIEPAGLDPRASMVVSPIYLESLKTYEHYASSDQLFMQAVEHFQLRREQPKSSIEGLKRAVLQVTIPRNTKILEIAATLPDARKSHALALYIAEETIKLNRKTGRVTDDELIAETRKRLDQAARRRDAAEQARARALNRAPTPEGLKADLEELRAIQEEISRRSLSSPLPDRLRQQAADLERQIHSKQQVLARRTTEIDAASAEYDAAWTAHDDLSRRLRELELTAGIRGERLTLLDSGVPPERPSSPNIPLNLLVAAGAALIASFLYLTVEFSVQSHRTEMVRKTIRMASKP